MQLIIQRANMVELNVMSTPPFTRRRSPHSENAFQYVACSAKAHSRLQRRTVCGWPPLLKCVDDRADGGQLIDVAHRRRAKQQPQETVARVPWINQLCSFVRSYRSLMRPRFERATVHAHADVQQKCKRRIEQQRRGGLRHSGNVLFVGAATQRG